MSPVKVVQTLLDNGWTLNDHGQVSYLLVGDRDDFDWQRQRIEMATLMEVLKQKEQRGELIGVVMTWKDTGIGGNFLIRNDGWVSVNLSINRKCIDRSEDIGAITDVNWYLIRLLPAFQRNGLLVQSFSYEEHV